MPNCGLLYIQFVVAYCSVVGLRNATVAEYVCVNIVHPWSNAGILVRSIAAIQALQCKMYRITQSFSYLYNLCAGNYQCYGEFTIYMCKN